MGKVAILLTQGFADWEYALLAGTGGSFYGQDIQFFSPEAGEIQSQGGLTASVSNEVYEITAWQPDVIVIIGGSIWVTDAAPDLTAVLTTHYNRGGIVAGICGGTLALARAGLLNNTPHTSNDLEFLMQNAQGYSGANHFQQSPVAITGDRVITATGTAPVSFTAAIFTCLGLDTQTVQQYQDMLAAEHG